MEKITKQDISYIVNILNISLEEIKNYDDIYKTLIKKLKIKLRELHPDNNGNNDEFITIHHFYELLQYNKKLDSNESLIKGLLNNKNLKPIKIEDIYKDIDEIILPPDKKFIVNISELVAHFNRRAYCEIIETTDLFNDTTLIQLDINAKGYNINEKETIKFSKCYTPTGHYRIETGIEIEEPSKITVSIDGFVDTFIRDIEKGGLYKFTFDENFVTVDLELHIKIKT